MIINLKEIHKIITSAAEGLDNVSNTEVGLSLLPLDYYSYCYNLSPIFVKAVYKGEFSLSCLRDVILLKLHCEQPCKRTVFSSLLWAKLLRSTRKLGRQPPKRPYNHLKFFRMKTSVSM